MQGMLLYITLRNLLANPHLVDYFKIYFYSYLFIINMTCYFTNNIFFTFLVFLICPTNL